jgi:hypothetical protein
LRLPVAELGLDLGFHLVDVEVADGDDRAAFGAVIGVVEVDELVLLGGVGGAGGGQPVLQPAAASPAKASRPRLKASPASFETNPRIQTLLDGFSSHSSKNRTAAGLPFP